MPPTPHSAPDAALSLITYSLDFPSKKNVTISCFSSTSQDSLTNINKINFTPDNQIFLDFATEKNKGLPQDWELGFSQTRI